MNIEEMEQRAKRHFDIVEEFINEGNMTNALIGALWLMIAEICKRIEKNE